MGKKNLPIYQMEEEPWKLNTLVYLELKDFPLDQTLLSF